MNAYVKTTIESNKAFIEFYHPASNSFPSEQLNALEQAFISLENEKNVSVIVLRSFGEKAFCAGASFDELLQVSNEGEGLDFFSGFAKVINAMRKSSKIIIGRIHGKTVGGGVGLAAACDYAFAHTQASVKLSELSIGIGPFVIEPAVSKKIGKQAMMEMSLEATSWKSSQWAFEHKLYNKVVESFEELDHEVEKLSNQLASFNPDALREMKKINWEDTSYWDELLVERAKISGRLVLSDFTVNALKQFKNK